MIIPQKCIATPAATKERFILIFPQNPILIEFHSLLENTTGYLFTILSELQKGHRFN